MSKLLMPEVVGVLSIRGKHLNSRKNYSTFRTLLGIFLSDHHRSEALGSVDACMVKSSLDTMPWNARRLNMHWFAPFFSIRSQANLSPKLAR